MGERIRRSGTTPGELTRSGNRTMLLAMLRKLFAILAALLLTGGYLTTEAAIVPHMPDCCAGGMCPMMTKMMREMMRQGGSVEMHCDMDMTMPGTQFQSCPASQHYDSTLVFIRIAPPTVLSGERLIEPLLLPALPAASATDLEVAVPPPRIALT